VARLSFVAGKYRVKFRFKTLGKRIGIGGRNEMPDKPHTVTEDFQIR
jgi:hypothetical protein